MHVRLRIAFVVLIIAVLLSGCISTGDDRSKVQTPELTDTSVVLAEDVNGTISLDGVGDVDCTIVTQYGGQTKSCSTQILSKDEKRLSKTEAHESLKPVVGKWVVVYGNLSTRVDLHFIGEGEFKSDGSYRITTYPIEFNPEEGLIEYNGRYNVDGLAVVGSGKSTILQNGEAFGATAVDKISAKLDPSSGSLTGQIASVSSFHEGSTADIATYDFVLERE